MQNSLQDFGVCCKFLIISSSARVVQFKRSLENKFWKKDSSGNLKNVILWTPFVDPLMQGFDACLSFIEVGLFMLVLAAI